MKFRSAVFFACSTTLLAGLALAANQWAFQAKQSQLGFVAVQAGAPFEGRFEAFAADIRFDPQADARGRFEIKIDLASVNTSDRERDDILKGPELFAVEQYPTATYVAESFRHLGGNKFVANGKLTLRNVTREVPIQFTFDKNATGAWLKGTGKLKRLDFGVGQGEWQDTSGVADEIEVRYALLLTKS